MATASKSRAKSVVTRKRHTEGFKREALGLVAVKVSVASKYIYAATFSGMTSGSRAGLSATVPTGFQLRVLPLQRFGF